jgi:hypothetical protein
MIYIVRLACLNRTTGAVKAGIDARTLIDAISASAGRNSAAEDKFPQSIPPRSFDYGGTGTAVRKSCATSWSRSGAPGPAHMIPVGIGYPFNPLSCPRREGLTGGISTRHRVQHVADKHFVPALFAPHYFFRGIGILGVRSRIIKNPS